MAWAKKAKISTETERGRILTAAGDQILVGENQDEVLIYQEEETLWQKKIKTTS